ncbi:MAG: hypothetical protein ACLFQU_11555 [Candidatus Kapaibacterium sp.]
MQIINDMPFHYYLILRAVINDMPPKTAVFSLDGDQLTDPETIGKKALLLFPNECTEENINRALSNAFDSIYITAYTEEGLKHREFMAMISKSETPDIIISGNVEGILQEKNLNFKSQKAVSTNTFLYSSLFAKLKRNNPVFVSFSNYLKENSPANELREGNIFEIFRISSEKNKIFDKDIALLINCSTDSRIDLVEIKSKMPSNVEVLLFGNFSNVYSDDYKKIVSSNAAHALFRARDIISAKYYILTDTRTDIKYHLIDKLIIALEESKKALIASPRLIYKDTPYIYYNGADAGFYKNMLTVYHRDNLKEEAFLKESVHTISVAASEDLAAVSNVFFEKIKISPEELIRGMEFTDLCMHVCIGNPYEIIMAKDVRAESSKAIPRGKTEIEHKYHDEFTEKWKDLFIPEKNEKETSMDLWEIWSRRELIFNPNDRDSLKLLYGNSLRHDNHREAGKWKRLLDEEAKRIHSQKSPEHAAKSPYKERVSNIINRVNELNRSHTKKLAAEIIRILFGRIIKPAELKKKETLALINEEKLSTAEKMAGIKTDISTTATIASLAFNPISVGALPYSAQWRCPCCKSLNTSQLTGTALSETKQVCYECGSNIMLIPDEFALKQLSEKFSSWEPDIFIRKLTLDYKKEDGVDLDQNLRFLINSYLASLIND